MAQARQEIEEYQAGIAACYEEFGLTPTIAIGGTVGIGYGGGEPPPGFEELAEKAGLECDQRVPAPAIWVAPQDEAAYQRMLDVRECLSAHGWPTPQPPSFATWKEQEFPWTAYTVLIDPEITPVANQPTHADLRELMEVCPQGGTGGIGIFDG
ncbi:MAG: hypothetical protein LBH13_01685 [Cellulomonadaceae bacterium]|jgi:hypothetical protein|nr:hypothetical protein [Cellulomonadaceae bacterium]